jgi:hypothetical protein
MGQYSGGTRQFGFRVDPKSKRLIELPEEQDALKRIEKLHARGWSPYNRC